VFKSKHMVTLAEGLQRSSVFAGLSIPYKRSGKIETRFGELEPVGDSKAPIGKGYSEVKMAGLGGGYIAFPLIFTGTVAQQLVMSGLPKLSAFLLTLIMPAVLTITLVFMLTQAQKDKFYPAMPVLTAGCIAGYLLTLLAAWIL